jgi:Domain of unknown function (DUF5069)
MSNAKDLTKEPPRSPRIRLGGYPILARAIDKGRATLSGNVGEYHFDCPLDNYLFGFKEVKGSDVKELLAKGSLDEEIVAWLDSNGASKTAEEIAAFTTSVEEARPYDHPDKKEWFVGECTRVGIDPSTNTLFDLLEADDKFSYKN